MKEYFFWMDSQFVRHVPQPAQRFLAQHYIGNRNGKIVYYSAEELTAVAQQLGLQEKLKRTVNISGFIFFTIKQFSYSKKLNFSLMKSMLQQGLELHFVREEYSIINEKDLEEKFYRLYLYDYSSKLCLSQRML